MENGDKNGESNGHEIDMMMEDMAGRICCGNGGKLN